MAHKAFCGIAKSFKVENSIADRFWVAVGMTANERLIYRNVCVCVCFKQAEDNRKKSFVLLIESASFAEVLHHKAPYRLVSIGK